ncbi:MAG: hypothetical protein ABSE51_20950 [Terracidiphilus sp.]|jgi:hypothetical protein
MEFSYKISEAEYLSAQRPKFKGRGGAILKTILFWVVVLALLMIVFTVFQFKPGHSSGVSGMSAFVLQAYLIILLLQPILLRRQYRKDPSMQQGQFTVEITPESISIRNTVGLSSQSGWNVFRFWYEVTGVIVLITRTGTKQLLSLAGLSDAQRSELRSILATALPKK